MYFFSSFSVIVFTTLLCVSMFRFCDNLFILVFCLGIELFMENATRFFFVEHFVDIKPWPWDATSHFVQKAWSSSSLEREIFIMTPVICFTLLVLQLVAAQGKLRPPDGVWMPRTGYRIPWDLPISGGHSLAHIHVCLRIKVRFQKMYGFSIVISIDSLIIKKECKCVQTPCWTPWYP